MLGGLRRELTSTFSLGRWRPFVYRADGKKIIALSFDDGPSPETTPRVLALLRSYNAKATFFLLGERAAAWPELVADMVRDGHAVYAHGYNHVRLDELPEDEAIKELADTEAVLARIRPTPSPYLMRLPFGSGHRDTRIHQLMTRWLADCQFAHWRYDFKDFRLAENCESKTELERRCDEAVKKAFADPRFIGGVALLHENPLGATGALVPEIAATLLERILVEAQARGLRVTGMTPHDPAPWWSPYVRTVYVE
jgi:peptidoglycan/xylan/chitin deacetylase (PgdA/CDA1 family)